MCTQKHDPYGLVERLDHERRRREVLAEAWSRIPLGSRADFTPQQRAELNRLDDNEPPPPPDGPVPFLAFAQLYARDVPDLAPPPHADLLQVLWCPWDHDYLSCPAVILRWRRADEVTVALDPQPEPELMEYNTYLPEPCVLYPEQIVEYQYADFLPADLHRRLREWSQETGHSYQDLSIASGMKVGGWSSWHLTDPYPMICECGADLELLLCIDGSEWDGKRTWQPVEDIEIEAAEQFHRYPHLNSPTNITIGRGYGLWIFTCPVSHDHRHQMSMQ
ncbi:hypothetical protein [Actinomadura geliboluensis]|uniref:hypothetical protein n=1 Tax=Actinomadura geliboluensis TaxID=882440 RepID=UPI0036B6A428